MASGTDGTKKNESFLHNVIVVFLKAEGKGRPERV